VSRHALSWPRENSTLRKRNHRSDGAQETRSFRRIVVTSLLMVARHLIRFSINRGRIMRVALVTGSAGFIGSFVCKTLLEEGWRVVGVDCMSDYYDVSLKESRESSLLGYENYRSIHERVETPNFLLSLFEKEQPDAVIHLAAQAGVRYSIDNPRSYLESNIIGTFELLEAARAYPPAHMLLASTSSAYGANTAMPYEECA